jgi:hypothetical protein
MRQQSKSASRNIRNISTVFAFMVCAGGLLSSGPVAAQGATSAAVTTTTGDPYKACNDGTSNEDHATCMKEAGAAKAEAQRGQLTNNDGDFRRNALQRCDALPADEKEPCRLRILGAGSTSGSVAGGGVIREVTTQTPTAEVRAGATVSAPAPAPR